MRSVDPLGQTLRIFGGKERGEISSSFRNTGEDVGLFEERLESGEVIFVFYLLLLFYLFIFLFSYLVYVCTVFETVIF